MVVVKTSSELNRLRESARIVALVHGELKKLIVPGVTTLELERVAKEIIRQEEGVPSFLGYKGYPHVICSSINEQIVHGFPNDRKLLSGDVLSIDVGVLKDGYHGDAAFTVGVGTITKPTKKLIRASYKALDHAVSAVKEGTTVGTIGKIIEAYAVSEGYSVVKNYVGHGIGRDLHEEPAIFNFGRDVDGTMLKTGMCICIEPMLCSGSANNHRLLDDWTVVTDDNSLSVHVEHQIIVHKDHGEVISVL